MPNTEQFALVPQRKRRTFGDLIRGIWSGPITSNSPELARLWANPPTATGIGISEMTALNYSAFWSAVNLIASDIAALPLVLLKRLPDGGKARFDTHGLYRLLHDQPNPEMTSMVWRRTMQAHVLTWGNGYSEIVRNQRGAVAELWPITPDRVTPFRRSADAALQYRVHNLAGGETIFDAQDILHVPGLGYTGTVGYSVVQKARESIGLGLAAERFGGTFFGNGAQFGGVISYPEGVKEPDDRVKQNLRAALNAQHQGVDRAHRFLALYHGAQYQSLGVPPDDAQFLQTRQFQVTEVARWFNIPPHKLGELSRSTNNNIEQQTIDYYTTTLLPWLRVWEQELLIKLVAPLERNTQLIEHLVEGLLRADAATRGETYSKQFSVAALTPNEIRASENRNMITGGDRAFVAMNLIPLDRVDAWVDAQIAAKNQPAAPPKPEPDPQQQAALTLALEERDAARRNAQEAEDLKDLANARTADVTAELITVRELHAGERREAEATIGRLTTQAETLTRDLALATADAETHRSAATIAGETVAQLQTALTAMTMDRDVCSARVGQEQARVLEVLVERDARRGERDQAVTERDALRLQAEAGATTVSRLTATLAETQAAIHDIAVDCVQRGLVQREVDRARKNQATPEKFRRWIETFFDGHDEVCRTLLRPIVRAWVIAAQHPERVDTVLDRLLAAHLEESTQQLRAVADETDPDALATALARVLTRWETERATRLADRIREEVAA